MSGLIQTQPSNATVFLCVPVKTSGLTVHTGFCKKVPVILQDSFTGINIKGSIVAHALQKDCRKKERPGRGYFFGRMGSRIKLPVP
jgi:hypothetical protein